MTIIEAITRIDALKPNQYTREEKVRWLSILDGMVVKEVVETHENTDGIAYTPYNDSTPLSKELVVAEPYAQEVYTAWLAAQIDFTNEEIARYSNDMIAFNSAYGLYTAWYTRTHMPIQKASVRTFCSANTAKPVLFNAVRVKEVKDGKRIIAEYDVPNGITESPLEQ